METEFIAEVTQVNFSKKGKRVTLVVTDEDSKVPIGLVKVSMKSAQDSMFDK